MRKSKWKSISAMLLAVSMFACGPATALAADVQAVPASEVESTENVENSNEGQQTEVGTDPAEETKPDESHTQPAPNPEEGKQTETVSGGNSGTAAGTNAQPAEQFDPGPIKATGPKTAYNTAVAGKVTADANVLGWQKQVATGYGETPEHHRFVVGDYNQDGTDDLYVIQTNHTATGQVEVHVLDGHGDYQTSIADIATAAPVSDDWEFQLKDYNQDGSLDLFAVRRGTSDNQKTELHIMNGADQFSTYLTQVQIPIIESEESNWFYEIGDIDNDKIPDLYVIRSVIEPVGNVEVHVISGASCYQEFVQQTATVLSAEVNGWDYAVDDYNGDGKPDVYGIKNLATGSGTTEVHVLDGATSYQSFIQQTATPYELGDETAQYIVKDGSMNLYVIKTTATGQQKTEVHFMGYHNGAGSISEQAYTLALKYKELGIPYVWGGTSLSSGVDCSGYIYAVYRDHFGITLPRTSGEQRKAGIEVSPSDMRVGDIVCYEGHVGFYAGDGMLLHASTPNQGIIISSANFAPIITVRRVI